MKPDYDLMREAMNGNLLATKILCGSYSLVRHIDSKSRYRFDGEDDSVPDGYEKLTVYAGASVYDKDGFLKPCYWSLPRIKRNGQVF